ncbi:MAG: hypothetical protein DWQ34_22645 [Planctomycetota bacterium]|nr:MAG: hypothetical protein DWQ34_22645 [Planctomycetota bacterium]
MERILDKDLPRDRDLLMQLRSAAIRHHNEWSAASEGCGVGFDELLAWERRPDTAYLKAAAQDAFRASGSGFDAPAGAVLPPLGMTDCPQGLVRQRGDDRRGLSDPKASFPLDAELRPYVGGAWSRAVARFEALRTNALRMLHGGRLIRDVQCAFAALLGAVDAVRNEAERLLEELSASTGNPPAVHEGATPPASEAAEESARDAVDVNDEIEAAKPISPKSKSEQRARWLAEAMLLVRDHPDWSDASIAGKVGKHKSQLSRSPEYKAAAALARESKATIREGHITTDPDAKLSDVEAVDPSTGWSENRADRGEAIPGSEYVREYCSECGEAMRVLPSKVGAHCICEDCQT